MMTPQQGCPRCGHPDGWVLKFPTRLLIFSLAVNAALVGLLWRTVPPE